MRGKLHNLILNSIINFHNKMLNVVHASLWKRKRKSCEKQFYKQLQKLYNHNQKEARHTMKINFAFVFRARSQDTHTSFCTDQNALSAESKVWNFCQCCAVYMPINSPSSYQILIFFIGIGRQASGLYEYWWLQNLYSVWITDFWLYIM